VTEERDDLNKQNKTNVMKIKKLSGMIVKNSQKSDEPLDQEVLGEMFAIRNKAAELIKTYFPGGAKFRPDLARRLGPTYRQFYEERMFPNPVPERRRRLLISLLFDVLQRLFFGPDAKRFGVPRETEMELQKFESWIETSNKGSLPLLKRVIW
jgi:hypothetical protein